MFLDVTHNLIYAMDQVGCLFV